MAIDDYNDDLEIMLIPPQVQFLLLETLNCWPEVKMHNLKILINIHRLFFSQSYV